MVYTVPPSTEPRFYQLRSVCFKRVMSCGENHLTVRQVEQCANSEHSTGKQKGRGGALQRMDTGCHKGRHIIGAWVLDSAIAKHYMHGTV